MWEVNYLKWYLTYISAGKHDLKTDARRFDTIDNILRSLTIAQSLKDRKTPIWRQREPTYIMGHMRLSGTDGLINRRKFMLTPRGSFVNHRWGQGECEWQGHAEDRSTIPRRTWAHSPRRQNYLHSPHPPIGPTYNIIIILLSTIYSRGKWFWLVDNLCRIKVI